MDKAIAGTSTQICKNARLPPASRANGRTKNSTGIPITVRQLEAIIRLSESIAKMHLQTTVVAAHVEEAHRLFKISTLNAAASALLLAREQI